MFWTLNYLPLTAAQKAGKIKDFNLFFKIFVCLFVLWKMMKIFLEKKSLFCDNSEILPEAISKCTAQKSVYFLGIERYSFNMWDT